MPGSRTSPRRKPRTISPAPAATWSKGACYDPGHSHVSRAVAEDMETDARHLTRRCRYQCDRHLLKYEGDKLSDTGGVSGHHLHLCRNTVLGLRAADQVLQQASESHSQMGRSHPGRGRYSE